jgi:hypothetical protein
MIFFPLLKTIPAGYLFVLELALFLLTNNKQIDFTIVCIW